MMKRGIYIVQCKNASANARFLVRLLRGAAFFAGAATIHRERFLVCIKVACSAFRVAPMASSRR
jgi:hypothetical protein